MATKRRSPKRLWGVLIDGVEYKQRTNRRADAVYGACLKHYGYDDNIDDVSVIAVRLIEGTPYEERKRNG